MENKIKNILVNFREEEWGIRKVNGNTGCSIRGECIKDVIVETSNCYLIDHLRTELFKQGLNVLVIFVPVLSRNYKKLS